MKIFLMVVALTFTGEAFADVGWVLWMEKTGRNFPFPIFGFPERNEIPDFYVQDGFGSAEGCKTKRTEVVKWLIKTLQEEYNVRRWKQLEIDKSFEVELAGHEKIYRINFLCLPNGTDPRPK